VKFRARDIHLAKRLGMSRPTNIRGELVARYRGELETYGGLHQFNANAGKVGRPSAGYYLNEQQALLICMFSRTKDAALIRRK
jgi:hypothetical protein